MIQTWCWHGQAGGVVTRPALVAATGDVANDSEKCGCSTSEASPQTAEVSGAGWKAAAGLVHPHALDS